MKTLKFRLWSEAYKKYFTSISLHLATELWIVIHNEDGFPEVAITDYDEEYVLEQYTGLKDKNGKEIYEGDIIIYDFTTYVAKEPVMGVVKYSAESAAYGIVPLAYRDSIEWFGELAINAPLEVVGNIHETEKK